MTSNKTKLLNYLKSQHTMTLATYDKEPWSCTVFYAVDNDFNFFFVSQPQTKHMKAIGNNNFVSCNIVDTNQVVTDKKIGSQIQGKVFQVKEKNKIKLILSMWHSFNPGYESIINLPNMIKKVIKSRVYRIKPTQIQFYNEALYKDNDFEIFEF